jgi:hypothetical protein
MPNKKQLSNTFSTEKPTKNTVKFGEDGDDSKFIMGTAYVQKRALAEIGNPDKVEVIIKPKA